MGALGIWDYVVIGTLLLLIALTPRLYAVVDAILLSRRGDDDEAPGQDAPLASDAAVVSPPAVRRTPQFARDRRLTASTTQRSMRYTPDELLSGVLATFDGEALPAEGPALAEAFNDLGARFPLLAPLAAADGPVRASVLERLRDDGLLQPSEGHYVLNAIGRERAVSRKRTLFNAQDCEQLEGAAVLLSALWPRVSSMFGRPRP